MRVLLVEDEENLAAAIRRGLSAEGIDVDVATDGVDGAHRAIDVGGYDAIVLDLLLPGRSGYRVLEDIRGADVWTPVLVLSAKDGEYDQADALDLGADDFLAKPFSYVVLLARLRALVRRGRPARPVVLRHGDLVLDPATRRVDRGGVPIHLTPREYAVLHFLLRHPDQVVTKRELLHGVWDAHYDGDHNVVEVYVGYVRRKIDGPFGTATVETVRGAGYRLSALPGLPEQADLG